MGSEQQGIKSKSENNGGGGRGGRGIGGRIGGDNGYVILIKYDDLFIVGRIYLRGLREDSRRRRLVAWPYHLE